MNSLSLDQTINNPSIPFSPIPTKLIIHQLSTIYNPTSAEFERLSQLYSQLFFHLLEQRQYPRSRT